MINWESIEVITRESNKGEQKRKHPFQYTSGFLMFSGGIERDQWHDYEENSFYK